MMDAKLAASSPGPDLKIQIKQGGKSDKATQGDGKSAFRDTLDGRLQSNGNSQGRIALKTETQRLDEARQLAMQSGADEGETPPAAPALLKKPLIQLGANGKPLQLSQEQPETDAAFDKGMIQRARTGKAAPSEKTSEKQAGNGEALSEGEAALMGILEDAGGDQPLALAADKTNSHKAGSEPVADAGISGDTDATEAAAKDALVLLKESAVHTPIGSETAPAGLQQQAGDTPPDGEEPGARGPSYRISRADGRGQQVALEARAGVEDGERPAAARSDVNSVLVVEQRRFLAPVSDNVLNIAGTLSGDPEWATAMRPDQTLANAAAQAGSGKVVNTLKIQMHPIELGLVTATLRLRGDELSVDLKVESGAAYRSLKDDQTRIIEALKAHGFAVDQVNISFSAERADQQAANQQNGQSSGFAQQQQQARDGSHNAPTSRERGHYERERNENGTASGDDVRVDAGSNGSRLPGHVYL